MSITKKAFKLSNTVLNKKWKDGTSSHLVYRSNKSVTEYLINQPTVTVKLRKLFGWDFNNLTSQRNQIIQDESPVWEVEECLWKEAMSLNTAICILVKQEK